MKKIAALFALAALSFGAFAQEDIKMPSQPTNQYKNLLERDHGYWIGVEGQFNPSLMELDENYIQTGLTVVQGYRFNDFIKLGIGAGIHYMSNVENVKDDPRSLVYPVFLEARGTMLPTNRYTVVPTWLVDVGYQFNSGFMAAVGPGMRIGEKRNAFTLSAGYTYQNIVKNGENKPYSAIFVRLGYEF